MVQDNNQKEPVDSSGMSVFGNFFNKFIGKENFTDEQVEAKRGDYWKCPKCLEINFLEEMICWKCDVSRPQKYEHPGLEEMRKELAKDGKEGLLWGGVVSILLAGVVIFRDLIRHGAEDLFDSPFYLIFAGFFAGLGVIMILIWLVRKISGK